MSNRSKVALVYCKDYELDQVRQAVKEGLTLLGGAQQFAKAAEKILIKPNLLVGDSPEKCISPHPMVFQAVLEEFQACGAELSFGDSPGFGSTLAAAKQSQMLPIAEALNVPIADFQNGETVSFHEGRFIKQFNIAKGVLEADGLISLAKMKAHALTRMTGAIKNQFGCIPGMLKAEFHSKLPSANIFSKMLVDLNLYIKPRLYIMDGIMAMEGNGPRNGDPRPMHVLLFSTDPVALDAAVCQMIHLNEALVDPIVYGNEFGLGSSKEIEFIGEPISRFDTPDFVVNRSHGSTSTDLGILTSGLMRNYVTPRPVIMEDKCTKCGRCVQVCPADPKALSWKDGKDHPPVYDYSECIRCYCCQELCPHEAISVQVPLLGRLLHRQTA
ncbi:MAG: DUF362 domain-containing protein [Anaerolineaceae bacterium]|nr:DUF362 domain-containing protein [Anaerolineaceae bacterium]